MPLETEHIRAVFTGQDSDIIRKKRKTDIGRNIDEEEAFDNIFFIVVSDFKKKMDDNPPPPSVEYQIPRTWEEVDEILFDELKAQKLSLQLKTTERRMFAIIAINSYIFTTLTNHMQWCITSALAFTAGFTRKIEELKERARRMKRELDEYQQRIVSSPYDREKINELMLERHLELTDPDKKIWSRLRRGGGLVQKYVDAEYNKARRQQQQRRLPPNEAAFNYNVRRGKTVLETSIALAQAETPPHSSAVEQNLSNFEFFEKYMRSDESLAPSNKLSEAYNVPYEVLPNITIKVPRRIERYINGEIEFMTKLCAPTVSNYTRGLVLSYMVGKMFGCAYLTSQAYMKAFADAVVERSPFFINKEKEGVTLSYSKIKLVLKSAKKRAAAAAAASTKDNIMTFPASHLTPVNRIPSGTREMREFIVKASEYSPSQMDKLAVMLMRSPVAEQAINGPIAEWFAINMSLLVDRKLDPQYALLLLVNWALTNNNTKPELMKRVINTFNIFFHHASGLAVPNIGFGVGMTRHRLKVFAHRLITQFVAPLVVKGSRNIVKPEPKTHVEVKDYGELVRMIRGNPECKTASQNSDLVVMSSGLFTNNDVYKKPPSSSSTSCNEEEDEEDKEDKNKANPARCCDCECHGFDRNLVGLTFEPSEVRRKIYEEEYNKMLMSQPHLLAEFGVCGYRHSLTASSDKKILVMTQLLKERLIYTQREVAAAIGWSRLLQFFLTNDKKSKYDIHDVKNKLYSLNRRYIEHFSTAVRDSLACDRLMENLNVKFNSDVLPLGRKPDSFIRTKAGLVVMEHAKKVLVDLYLREDSYPDYKRLVAGDQIPQYMIDSAARCVTGADYTQEYHIDEPFCKRDEENFEPIPMFGVRDLLFVDPADAKYVFDNTAIKSSQLKSVFRIKRDDVNFTEANVARGVISNAQLTNNVDAAKVLFSGNNSCKPVFKGMRDIFKKSLLVEEPRKMDDHTPWSSKNTGQSGRNTTEFNVNSVMLVVQYDLDENGETRGLDDYENDVFLSMVDSQRTVAQKDIMYPDIVKFSESDPTETIEAPDYSPVYRHGSKTVAISLK